MNSSPNLCYISLLDICNHKTILSMKLYTSQNNSQNSVYNSERNAEVSNVGNNPRQSHPLWYTHFFSNNNLMMKDICSQLECMSKMMKWVIYLVNKMFSGMIRHLFYPYYTKILFTSLIRNLSWNVQHVLKDR